MAATYLQSSMASSIPCSSSSSSSPSLKRRSFKTLCAVNIRNSAKIPMPPVNPNDSFISRLASAAANSPEKLLNRPSNSDMLPFLDIFESPTLMATPAQVERSASYGRRSRRPPPDLPSLLLDGRVVYIGMPLVPAVTELVIAQLLYLQWMDPKEPLYLYINSTGTTRDDGETVGLETEGFAIYDALMHMKCEIHTVAIGHAIGQACLLLAAGTKGKRYMFPHAKALLQQPRVPPSGLMAGSDVLIRTREAIINRDTLVELLAKHTGNPVDVIANVMRGPFYMDGVKAREFGVIDKILWRGQEKIMKKSAPTDAWYTTPQS